MIENEGGIHKTQMLSLNTRVLFAGSAVLASFFGLAGIILQQAFDQNAENALKDRLLGQVYIIIAAAQLTDDGDITMPDVWNAAKFSMLSPTLYAQISNPSGEVVWDSIAMQDVTLPAMRSLERNQSQFYYFNHQQNNTNIRLAITRFAVAWDDTSRGDPYIFSVAASLEQYDLQASQFTRNLWISLAAVALLMLLLQGQIIRWELLPLRTAKMELEAIESGKQQRLTHRYPGELLGLTNNINALLQQQQEHLKRYRHTLGDLAHSLKTPLAVLQSALEAKNNTVESEGQLKAVVQEQLDRMRQITDYQLQRAATAGQTALVAPVKLHYVVDKIIRSLHKVYADKSIKVQVEINQSVVFYGDESDLMEMLGNLIDNAFKWCNHRVIVNAHIISSEKINSDLLEMVIEDDGPGIPESLIDEVMRRGGRADSNVVGHGIGLSMVKEIITVYKGHLTIKKSEWGGASVELRSPNAKSPITMD